MNDHEPLMKPLVLDLLALVERTLSLAHDAETTATHPGAIAQANELVRAALDVLPHALDGSENRDAELESLPPALPSRYEEQEAQSLFAAGAPPPANDWLLGDDDGFNLT